MTKKITSSGILRDVELPRVGVTSSIDWDLYGYEISQGIDLAWEEFMLDLAAEGIEEDSAEWWKAVDRADISGTKLFGDWVKGADGRYLPNQSGPNGFAAEYNPDTGIVCVEWSKTTVQCHHTSPCYVMSDGRGPCGDLDTPGDSVIAYALPEVTQ